ncbi:sugar ABC transporter ATP-binding protein [Arhodomonas sp. AD133]|uniref:sugar ABC transporter ATP-binding protein n=1 Tax=Arhodomonas sp. AD133 TaxID=3415009 RepID=UPI003EBCF458
MFQREMHRDEPSRLGGVAAPAPFERPAASPAADVSFALHGVTKRFPGVLAVDNVDLRVDCGELHGIIGRNGAGKSVLVSMIAGLQRPTEGEIQVGGHRVHAQSYTPARAREHGVVLIPQEPQFAELLSVTDNLFMGAGITGRFGLLRPREMTRKAREIIETLELDGVTPHTTIRDLPIESQQLLAFARAYYIDQARGILLDEITASLSRSRKQALLRLLRDLLAKTPGLSFTLISHHVSEVMEFCDRVTVMRDGRRVATLATAESSERTLAEWIVGDTAASIEALKQEREPVAADARTVMEARNLSLPRAFDDLSFELRAGEVLGFAGLDGSGKEAAMEAIFGLHRKARGAVRLHGQPAHPRTPEEAIARGIVYLPKHREAEGIVQNMTVAENTLLSSYGRFLSAGGFIDSQRTRETVQTYTRETGVKTRSTATPIDFLSGGNKQKVLINRLALAEPSVFLLNEPTRGVDIASKPALLATVRRQLSETTGVIMTSESEDEMIEVCDRILVFYRGCVVRTLERGADDFTVAELYRTIQGVTDQ